MKRYNRKHINEVYTTNEGYECKVIDGGSKPNYCTCKIENYIFEANYDNVKRGKYKYPFFPSVYNVGYIGVGKYKTKINGKNTKP